MKNYPACKESKQPMNHLDMTIAVDSDVKPQTKPKKQPMKFFVLYKRLSHDVVSGNDITLCNKIDIPLVVYRFSNIT